MSVQKVVKIDLLFNFTSERIYDECARCLNAEEFR